MSPENRRQCLVLVVDDEALIRWALSEELAERGYTVQQASTGAEARLAIETDGARPLVVLLDLRLPDVGDLSLCREIRARRPDAPIVLMTAHGTADDEHEARRLGVFEFVTKPFDVPQMIRLVDRAVAHRTEQS